MNQVALPVQVSNSVGMLAGGDRCKSVPLWHLTFASMLIRIVRFDPPTHFSDEDLCKMLLISSRSHGHLDFIFADWLKFYMPSFCS